MVPWTASLPHLGHRQRIKVDGGQGGLLQPGFDVVADLAHLFELFAFGAGGRGRVGEGHVGATGDAGKDRAFGLAVVAYGHHVVEQTALLEEREEALGQLLGKVDSPLRP